MASGCQTAVSTPAAPSPTAVPPSATPLPPTAVPIITPSPNPTATNTAVPTPLPSPTTPPAIRLYLPPEWAHLGETAVTQLNRLAPAWTWTITTDETQAQAALVNNADGAPVYEEPLAFVVPFATAWENTDEATAQGILDYGHALVTVMPWRNIFRTQKALRIDGRFPTDADYPFHTAWSLVGEAGLETAVAQAAPIFQALMADPVVHVAAVGDIMLDRTLGRVISDGGIEFPFKLVAGPLQNADITIGNLETALGSSGQPEAKRFTFQSPPAAADSLAWGGFDVVSLANNHAMDYGPESLLEGIGLLEAQGIAPVGAGEDAAQARSPRIISVNGLDVAFLGYTHVPVEASTFFDTAEWTAAPGKPGLAWAVPAEISEDVAAIKPDADLVVVMLHSGYEYVEPPSEEQAAAAHAAIDAGADIVIGHHAHILQGVEFYNEGVIVYGLGNFAFNIDGDPNTAILNVWLDGDGVRQIEFIPAVVQYGGQPRLAEGAEAEAILSQIYRLSQGFPRPRVP